MFAAAFVNLQHIPYVKKGEHDYNIRQFLGKILANVYCFNLVDLVPLKVNFPMMSH